jgi:DNA-binding transcriptional regulator YdaS (Cro superfamily)
MGVVYVSAHQWVKGICELPILRAIQLEQLTNGQVRADQMRPDAADAMAYLRGKH